ncbi:MAG TPA: thioredoxin [Saprospiraceae bacterium]|nr:thioredoxin [Saprospiraceae bacterium]
MAINVTDATFEEVVLQSDKPVFVDFWAAWCGPCRMIHPIMDQISEEYNGRAIVAKVDVDSNQKFAAEYGVRNIPTVILFKDGKQFAKQVGVASKSVYVEKVEEALK